MPTYIYAITRVDHPLNLDGLQGVGDPPSELRTVTTKDLAAVVSQAPSDLRAKRRDLLAHQGVLERLMTDGAALPMRFGLLGPDDDSVLAVLEEQRDPYRERLEELRGCLEYNLKVARDEQDLLHEILTDSDEVRGLNEHTRDHPEAQDEKVALGELIMQEVQQRESTEAALVVDRLAPAALRTAPADPTTSHFLNVSFLVTRESAAVLSQAVHEEAERHGDAYTFTLNGPLPPYSFV
ncbi:Gas vesicle synthesis protein GvpL/GvpF [Streptomyces sp. YIM 130001]|uniref:GvpL/GvpF family gas vesicle protein n=1 Tax=Streptomyces sp. YIM 130001 TaxID=2259644 RepID=UPI000E658814|nr:GvpL/GvpF family gas vesicle protein [Streptomyces sp. YIM 130001]RII20412.1 Gas vesicle synthesis protein GvpL/GvpF [Streptomyces sp. YIM 130001]